VTAVHPPVPTPATGATALLDLRAATDADEPFLRAVYAQARAEEVAAFGWPPAEVHAFLTIQFDAQRRHLRAAYPASVDAIVVVDGVPAGRLWVDRGADAVTVIDLALLTAHRGAGTGGRLLRDLQADAAARGVPVRLRVLRTSRARHLYERLGFRPVPAADAHDDQQRLALRWMPPGPAEWTAAAGTPGRLAGLPALVVDCSVPLVQGPYERYGVHFRVPADAALGQGTYRVEHPAVGAVDVFVVPTAHTGDGLVLTATFVREAGTIVGEPATLAREAGSP
jgi:GNAT superfamily N-acetyltransferase